MYQAVSLSLVERAWEQGYEIFTRIVEQYTGNKTICDVLSALLVLFSTTETAEVHLKYLK